MLEAERDFVAALVQRLDSGDFGGVRDWARLHEMLAAGLPREDIAAEIASYAATFTGEGRQPLKEHLTPAPSPPQPPTNERWPGCANIRATSHPSRSSVS